MKEKFFFDPNRSNLKSSHQTRKFNQTKFEPAKLNTTLEQ